MELSLGQRVLCSLPGEWTAATVIRDFGDLTYSLQYEDGEIEVEAGLDDIRLEEDPSAETTDQFIEGAKVEGNYRGRGKWYPGKIAAVLGDGSFDLLYDDGEKETSLDRSLIRLVDAPPPPVSESAWDGAELTEGAKVEANYRGRGKWYPGKISRDRGDALFDIDYDDGEKETRVEKDLIRLVAAPAADAGAGDAEPAYAPSEPEPEPEAEPEEESEPEPEDPNRTRGRWFRGVWYPERERPRRRASPSPSPSPSRSRLDGQGEDQQPPAYDKLEVHSLVQARYLDDWFPAKVVASVGKDCYDVLYLPGDAPSSSPSSSASAFSASLFMRGVVERGLHARDLQLTSPPSRIEANKRGLGQWAVGKVARDHLDGSFDVAYDDGEWELRVDKSDVRRFGPGSRVECNWRGYGGWYMGVVTRRNVDGTFDLVWEGYGYGECDVDEGLLRLLPGAAPQPVSEGDTAGAGTGVANGEGEGESSVELAEGARVEVDYRGRGRYYAARIARDNGDGTFDVTYEDGDQETGVARSLIRLLGVPPPPVSESAWDGAELTEGAKVEANYRGRGKWYPGKISRDRGDGTFDIDYDDGEKETRVEKDLIRLVAAPAAAAVADGDSSAPEPVSEDGAANAEPTAEAAEEEDEGDGDSPALTEGTRVEVNYRGHGRFYPAKVSRDNGDRTFDIDYDDGEKELGVRKKLIVFVAAPEPPEPPKYQAGARCEANYKGRGTWLAGEIFRIRAEDESCDVYFDLGFSETRVQRDCLRLLPL